MAFESYMSDTTSQDVSNDEMKTIVSEKIEKMIDSIIREEIEKEIDEKISGKKISAWRRTRIYKKVNDEVKKNVPSILAEIMEKQIEDTIETKERRVSDEIKDRITEKIRNIVQRSMEKAIADEIFEKVKFEKLRRTPTASPELRMIGVRHVQIFMLFLFLAISYVQRVDISVAIVAMTDKRANPNFGEFIWNESVKGLVLSSFYWGYFLSQIPGGIIAEKFGPKTVMCWSMVICSTAALFVPAATILGDWLGLYIMKAIQGISQATFMPATYVFSARWIPPNEKSRLFTPAFGGMQMGAVVGMPIAAFLCTSVVGWPSVFFFSAIIGYAWSIAWALLAANSPAVHRSISREEQLYIEGSFGFGEITIKGMQKTIPWKPILMSIPFWALMIAHFGQNWVYFTLLTKMPTYINVVLRVDFKWNGVLSASAFFVGWIFIIIFGFMSNFIRVKELCGLETERKLWNSFAFYTGGIAFIILGITQTTRVDLAMGLITAMIATNSGVYNGLFSNHVDLSPNYVGILMGLSNTLGNLASLLAPLFVAQVVTEPEKPSQWSRVFLVSAAVIIISNTIYIIFGSSKIQWWNTPSDLHLQLQEDAFPRSFGSSKRQNYPYLVSNTELLDVKIHGNEKEREYRKSI